MSVSPVLPTCATRWCGDSADWRPPNTLSAMFFFDGLKRYPPAEESGVSD
jgi:hypothetical protein